MTKPGEPLDPIAVAAEIDREIRALPAHGVQPARTVRRAWSRRLRAAPAEAVLAVAMALVDRQRWVAYELLSHHPGGLDHLSVEEVERLGEGMGDWGSVDAFACTVSGPAWRRGRLPDAAVQRWAASPDRWWRRAALVSTVPLNLRSRGGTGDAGRTLEICRRLAGDGDDMVVKALSWALRELTVWDPEAVRRFLDDHHAVLAARVRREVRSKLETGRKHPTPPATGSACRQGVAQGVEGVGPRRVGGSPGSTTSSRTGGSGRSRQPAHRRLLEGRPRLSGAVSRDRDAGVEVLKWARGGPACGCAGS